MSLRFHFKLYLCILLTKLFSLSGSPLTCGSVYIPAPEHILFVSREVLVSSGRNGYVGRFDPRSKLKQNFILINQIISRI